MTSAIIFDTVDESFPVAGQDNNSQGFRDNFTIIKNGLATANSEITDLQNNTAKTDQDNNFNGVQISNAETLNLYGSVSNLGNISANTSVIATEADFFHATVTSDLRIDFDNWPLTNKFRKIYVVLKTAGTQRNVTFGGGTMRYNNFGPIRYVSVPADTNASVHLEVSSYDAGTTIFVNNIGTFVA